MTILLRPTLSESQPCIVRASYCVVREECNRFYVANISKCGFILWEDHSLKPSTCPHAAEMGALREAARDNILLLR